MKVSRSFSLDEELIPQINAEDSPSDLANTLFHHHYDSQTSRAKESLEEILKRAEILQNEVLKQNEKARADIEADIKLKIEARNKLDQEAEKQLQENITLLEGNQEITKSIIDYFTERKSKGLPLDMTHDNEEVYNKIMEFVDLYRKSGLRVGTHHIKDYLKFKGIFI